MRVRLGRKGWIGIVAVWAGAAGLEAVSGDGGSGKVALTCADGTLIGWQYALDGQAARPDVATDGTRGVQVAPVLTDGSVATLSSLEPCALAPHHEHEVTLDLRGAHGVRWAIDLVYTDDPQAGTVCRLWPRQIDGIIDPAPAWQRRTVRFITPAATSGARLRFVWSRRAGVADAGMAPAIAGLALADLGPVAFGPPSANVLFNGDCEAAAGTNGPVPGWSGQGGVTDAPGEAHGGRRCYRLTGTGRALLEMGNVHTEAPVALTLSAWAKGQGTLTFSAAGTGPGNARLAGAVAPARRLTPDWRQYKWEAIFARGHPCVVLVGGRLEIAGAGGVDVDDVEMRVMETAR